MAQFTAAADVVDVGNPMDFPGPVVSLGMIRKLPVKVETEIFEVHVLQAVDQQHQHPDRYYEVGRILKETIYGQVNHAFILDFTEGLGRRREQCAIKVYVKRKLREYQGRTQENPIIEISAQQFIGHHENVATALECCHDADHIYSVMEYGGDEVFEEVDEVGALPEDRARIVFRQILSGVEHLQTHGVAHRDLSLENVLITSEGICKVIDFGMALRMPLSEPDAEGNRRTLRIPPQGVCGKKNYISPEVLENAGAFHGFASDMWAVGVMLFILTTGIPPVDAATPVDPRFLMVRDGRLAEMLSGWGIQLNPALVDLLGRMLRVNPQERLTPAQILEHPWMQS